MMLLVLIFGISASFASDTDDSIQATDDDTSAVTSTGDETLVSESETNEVNSASEDNDVLAAAGSFTELSTLINSSTTGSITLEKDYTYNSATDSAFVEGISIDRLISIDGNGKTISGNNAARIFNVYGSNILIRDVNFVNGYTTGNTGAINWYGANGYLVSSTFQNNVAKNYGALYWEGTGGSITSCTFKENHATTSYGAACINVDEIKINECTFEKNYANDDYGALGIKKSYCIVSNSNFKDNNASDLGGALSWEGSQGTLINSHFNNNYASSNGAVRWTGSFGIVDNCNFTKNIASTSIGAAFFNKESCRILETVFDNNEAKDGHSGALRWDSSGGYLLKCTFTNNKASDYSGAFSSSLDFRDVSQCYFYNNTAKTAGAYRQITRNPRVLNCTFESNHALEYGGAIVTPGAVFDSMFINNIADTDGGAIRTMGVATSFRGNTFIGNQAVNGGAFSIMNAQAFISDSKFENNKASENGGAIYSTANYVYVGNSIFNGNTATLLGGAIYNSGNYFTTYNSTFNNNRASSNSGAIFVSEGKSVLLDYSLKTNNDKVNATNKIDMPHVVYVAVDGTSSGTGAENSPMDLVTGLQKVANGGYVYIKPGTYTPNAQVTTNSKTLNIIGLDSVTFDFSKMTTTGFYFQGPCSLLCNVRFINEVKSKYTIHGDNGQYIIIRDCIFENTGQLWFGGRFWTLDNCTFINNHLTNKPIVTSNFFQEYIYNCKFINNSNTGNGIVNVDVKTGWKIINCTFENNVAKNGGAIYTNGFELEVINCTFINNTATEKGGAIYSGGQEIVITGCSFEKNNAVTGGATYIVGVKSSIENSDFIGNNASDGGAVYSTGRGSSISDSNFTGNNASSSGGAVYSTGMGTSVSGSNFTGNGASDEGGAIYSTGTGTSVSGSSFGQNSATNGSAVMVGENTDITIEGSNFNNNTGNGSVYVPEGSNFVIDSETTFENNTGGDLETPGVVSAKVLYVNITATGDGLLVTGPTNWEQGFANVQDDGILYILPGTYDMSLLSPIIVDRTLSIIGIGEGVIFTNGARGTIFDIRADNVKLSNIKFNGISGDYIKWDGTNGEIESCTFDGQGTSSNNKLITTTVTSANFKVTNTNFTNLKYGNLIYTTNYLTTVENAIFKSNTQYNTNSVLIDAVGSDFSIVNSKFESNNAKLVKFESNANRGLISGTTFTSNVAGSGNSLVYINSKQSTVSGSTFKSSNTGGTYKYIYGTEDFTLSGNTFEGVTASLNSVSGVTYPNNPTVSGTFNYGVNRANTIPVTANGVLLPNVARSSDATTFSYAWDKPLPNSYTLTIANTDSEGNKYTFTSTPNSVSTTVNRLTTVYISPSGTGTGASASSPTTWENVANLLTDTGKVVFTAGTYSNFYGKTVNKGWTLSGTGTVTLDANNKGRIFTVSANNVKIEGLTFKNGKTFDSYGSAIHWTRTGGTLTNSILIENTGRPVTATNAVTISNTQMKDQVTLTKSNINWGATETITATFAHSAPSKVTVLFTGASQGEFTVTSNKATANIAFTNPSTQAVGSYAVTEEKQIQKEAY